jgi:hypothetical protein
MMAELGPGKRTPWIAAAKQPPTKARRLHKLLEALR